MEEVVVVGIALGSKLDVRPVVLLVELGPGLGLGWGQVYRLRRVLGPHRRARQRARLGRVLRVRAVEGFRGNAGFRGLGRVLL